MHKKLTSAEAAIQPLAATGCSFQITAGNDFFQLLFVLLAEDQESEG